MPESWSHRLDQETQRDHATRASESPTDRQRRLELQREGKRVAERGVELGEQPSTIWVTASFGITFGEDKSSCFPCRTDQHWLYYLCVLCRECFPSHSVGLAGLCTCWACYRVEPRLYSVRNNMDAGPIPSDLLAKAHPHNVSHSSSMSVCVYVCVCVCVCVCVYVCVFMCVCGVCGELYCTTYNPLLTVGNTLQGSWNSVRDGAEWDGHEQIVLQYYWQKKQPMELRRVVNYFSYSGTQGLIYWPYVNRCNKFA